MVLAPGFHLRKAVTDTLWRSRCQDIFGNHIPRFPSIVQCQLNDGMALLLLADDNPRHTLYNLPVIGMA